MSLKSQPGNPRVQAVIDALHDRFGDNAVRRGGDVLIGITGERVHRHATVEQLTKSEPRAHRLRRQAVYFSIASIAEDQSRIGSEHQHSLRHVVENRIEQALLIVCRGFVRAGSWRELPDR